jgi:hypothetical protein
LLLKDNGTQSIELLLPGLKRPTGWGALDADAVRSRAAQTFLAFEASKVTEHSATPDMDSRSTWASIPRSPDAMTGTGVAETNVAQSYTADAKSTERDGADLSRFSWGYRPVMWGGLLCGIVFAPWVVWAPVLGGLSFGLLIIQAGLLKRWLMPSSSAIEVEVDWASQDAIALNAPHGSRHGSGWLLVALLVLFGVQAIMLLTALNMNSRESMVAIQNLQSVQRQRTSISKRADFKAMQSAQERPDEGKRSSDELEQDVPTSPPQSEMQP